MQMVIIDPSNAHDYMGEFHSYVKQKQCCKNLKTKSLLKSFAFQREKNAPFYINV